MAAPSHHITLRDRQIASIEKILNLNRTPAQTSEDHFDSHANGLLPESTPIVTEEGQPIWKVLVFDNLGRDVISSVMRVNDLRACGVTIHLNINTTRHMIPDVPVIYLVQPTSQNLQFITSDLSRGLYSPAYINFLYSIPRPLLEEFASSTATSETAEHIAQVYDQYLNFIVSEPDLFSLGMGKDTYWQMNSVTTTEDQLAIYVERIVTGLFSVVVTMGTIPIIRCPKAGAAEMVAARLDRKLRDHILDSKDNSLFSGSSQKGHTSTPSSRPILIIVDRTVDLVPMLSHSWTYHSLVNDILNMRLNQITVTVPGEKGAGDKPITKQYDLKANDFFWAKNASQPFPNVAQDIDAELSKYKEDAAEVTRKTGTSSLDDLHAESGASAAQLKAAITLLPELRERKAVLDMHMNIAHAILKGVADRQLDNFYQLEENVSKQTKSQMLELINDIDKGSDPMDKLRLFIIWFLSVEQEISRSDMGKFDEALRNAGADTTSLAYIKKVRELTRMTMMASAPISSQPQQTSSSDLLKGFTSISNRLTSSFKEAGLGANIENLISGVKNFLPANKDLTLTKITESLMDPANASSAAIARTEDYRYYDPRSASARGNMPPVNVPSGRGSPAPSAQGAGAAVAAEVSRGIEASFGQRRQGFSEAIVFTVGGGSIDEYGNLQEWLARVAAGGMRRRVIYGSTEILNARDFIREELERLGREN